MLFLLPISCTYFQAMKARLFLLQNSNQQKAATCFDCLGELIQCWHLTVESTLNFLVYST